MPPRRQASQGVAAAAAAAAAAAGGGGGGAASPAYRHCFLQAIMQRQYIKEVDAKQLFRQITGEPEDSQLFLHFLAEVNQHLEFAQFELRRIKYLGDGEHYLGFVNREADEASKRSVKYRTAKDGKPDTRVTAYFKALLERIATSATAEGGLGYIAAREALNLVLRAEPAATQEGADEDEAAAAAAHLQQAEEVSKLGMRDRETALAQLVADGWLAFMSGKPGCYTLGPRTFLELGRYILALDLPPAAAQALQGLMA